MRADGPHDISECTSARRHDERRVGGCVSRIFEDDETTAAGISFGQPRERRRDVVETIDEVSASCVEALTATGSNFMQTVFQGIIPSSMAQILSWILYMIETNIRDATLVGILTGTGIGFLFDLYFKRLDYASASLVILAVVILVIAIEMISNKIRKVIL